MLVGLGAPAAIVGDNAKCVSFVVANDHDEDAVVRRSAGLLVRYYFGEDHGMWLRFFVDREEIGKLEFVCDPMDPETGEDRTPGPPAITAGLPERLVALGALTPEGAVRIGELRASFDWTSHAAREALVEEIPGLLHLAACRWVSGDAFAHAGMEGLPAGAELVE